MAVITTDILLTGIRRDHVFEWLSDSGHHASVLQGAFEDVRELEAGHFDLGLNTPPKNRVLGYRFIGPDDSHGGRRILVETTGKRTSGKMHYSLRTMKPSTNTLVTLHIDYDPGGTLGSLLNAVSLRQTLETCMKTMLENLSREIPREA